MPVKIRLMRIGAKKRPFYRVVAVDERKKRTGGYLELLGTYNPIVEPKEIILKQDLIDAWLKKGAVPSDGFLRITGKAPQRPPRKAKKEKAPEAAPVTPAAPVEETPEEVTNAPEKTDGEIENDAQTQAEVGLDESADNTQSTEESTPDSSDQEK